MLNDEYNGETLLMGAARNGYSKDLRFLLDRKACLDIQDENGETALDLAQRRGETECAELLIAAALEGDLSRVAQTEPVNKTQDMSEEECKAIFKRIDTDGDGSLSEAELAVIFGDGAADALGDMDKNKDGGLDEAEWMKSVMEVPESARGKLCSTMNKCLDDGTTWSKDLME